MDLDEAVKVVIDELRTYNDFEKWWGKLSVDLSDEIQDDLVERVRRILND